MSDLVLCSPARRTMPARRGRDAVKGHLSLAGARSGRNGRRPLSLRIGQRIQIQALGGRHARPIKRRRVPRRPAARSELAVARNGASQASGKVEARRQRDRVRRALLRADARRLGELDGLGCVHVPRAQRRRGRDNRRPARPRSGRIGRRPAGESGRPSGKLGRLCARRS